MSCSNGSSHSTDPLPSESIPVSTTPPFSYPNKELQMPRDAVALELHRCLVDYSKSAYRLAGDSGVDVGNLHRLLKGERSTASRETLLRLGLGLTLSDTQVDCVVEAINRLFDAAGLKTL